MGAFTCRDPQLIKDNLAKVLRLFPRLEERRKQVAGTLSGGEQQMLATGRALMANPRVLLLDEPSMGLAPVLVDSIFDTIRELHAEGTTILLVEQNARMALQVASRGYVLQSGVIVLSNTAETLRQNEMVRKAYLGET
jgi:branched-chain amino acid transport system ATP-binding protein